MALNFLIVTVLLIDNIWCRVILIAGLSTLILSYGLKELFGKNVYWPWRAVNALTISFVPLIISWKMLLVVVILTIIYNTIPNRKALSYQTP